MYPYLYPNEWQSVSEEIRAACNWQCQQCNRQCRRPGELNLGWQYQLHVAHYFHDYTSPETFVTCLCAPCHFLHDSPFVWQARRRVERYRRMQCGQLTFAFH